MNINNYTLHKLKEGFIITSNEDIKEGDLYYEPTSETNINVANKILKSYYQNKIIAQQNQIDFSSLSVEEQKKIGWFDIVQFGKQKAIDRLYNPDSLETRIVANEIIKAVKSGFEKAQELLSDRMFTVEDMEKAIIQFATDCDIDQDLICYNGHDSNGIRQYNSAKRWFKEYVQSLSQYKSWEIEIELEERYDRLDYDDNDEATSIQPKITNDKIKILKLL
jgi:hypothetical protein